MVCFILVLIGGLNWGLVGFTNNKFNLVHFIGRIPIIENSIYILVFIAAVILLVQRNTYLPFLGETVYPVPLEDVPTVITKDGPTSKVTLDVPSNSKVVYWAAQSAPNGETNYEFNKPKDAYANYSNYGIGTSDKNGDLTVTINTPASYKLWYGVKKSHIHYRYWLENGFLSSVYTQYL